MDTIASMRAFVAVAKAGSFSAAAQKLDLVPSVIIKRVMQLERIVGTTLFHRSTRKVVLSADGEHHLRRIIAASGVDRIAQGSPAIDRPDQDKGPFNARSS